MDIDKYATRNFSKKYLWYTENKNECYKMYNAPYEVDK